MLFDSSLRKELARSFGATAIVLVTVLVTMTLIRVLGQASRGNFNPADVMLVMGYTVVTFMPNLMSLALFIAVVMTLSRIYADSEMVIWFSSRIGLARLLPALLRFAWPVLLAIALLSLLALPWARTRSANCSASLHSAMTWSASSRGNSRPPPMVPGCSSSKKVMLGNSRPTTSSSRPIWMARRP